jgi:hypothetical protein
MKKPYVGYRPMCSSGMYVCHGCNGLGNTSVNDVVHLPDCPHYPSEGNRNLEERLKAQGLFKGSKWDRSATSEP